MEGDLGHGRAPRRSTGVAGAIRDLTEIGTNFVGRLSLGGRDLEHLEKKIHDFVRDPRRVADADDLGALDEVVLEVGRVLLHLDVLASSDHPSSERVLQQMEYVRIVRRSARLENDMELFRL